MDNASDKPGRRYFYQEHSRACADTDYWGQVKRTVHGKPVTQDQIDMILAAVVAGLALNQNDMLLDLCCGNGALSALVFGCCAGGVGVDYSEHLIEVAQRDFAKPGRETYQLGEALSFLETHQPTRNYNKALCYGAFAYFSRPQALLFLKTLRDRFAAITQVFVGNLADRCKMHLFFQEGQYQPGMEDDPASPVGVWWSRRQFFALSRQAGWHAEFRTMPATFYAAHYRFDAILTPLQPSDATTNG